LASIPAKRSYDIKLRVMNRVRVRVIKSRDWNSLQFCQCKLSTVVVIKELEAFLE